ncbi:MAG: hypothetical protein QW039_05635 [Fervidicoccaceae archaeon]
MLLLDAYVIPRSPKDLNDILKAEKLFGYRAVGVDYSSLPSNISSEEISVFPVRAVSASTEAEAKEILHNIRKNDALNIARANGAGALRVFSRDSRIHIVEISPKLAQYLDSNQAKLLKVGRSLLGFSLSSIQDDLRNVWWLSYLTKYSVKYSIGMVIYSGARELSELAHPKIVLSMLVQTGLTREMALSIMDGSKLEWVLSKYSKHFGKEGK